MFVGRLKSEVPKSIQAIAGAISSKEIQELNISDNALGPIGVESIDSLLKILTTLKRLLIANNGLGPVNLFLFNRSRKAPKSFAEPFLHQKTF